MKWNHIMDCQPEDNRDIIQVDPPYFGHRSMGMRKYEVSCTFEAYLHWCDKNDLPNPDFWWVYAEDFPFPDDKGEKNT